MCEYVYSDGTSCDHDSLVERYDIIAQMMRDGDRDGLRSLSRDTRAARAQAAARRAAR